MNAKVTVAKYRDRKNLVLCFREPETDRLFTRSAGTANKADAQKAAGAWETEISEGRWTPETRRRRNAKPTRAAGVGMSWVDFRGYFETHYKGVKKVVRAATHANQASTFNTFEALCSPEVLTDLNTPNVTKFSAMLRNPMEGGRIRSEATVGRHLRHLRVIARWANKKGLLPTVPDFDIPTGTNKAKARAVTPEEFDRLLVAAAEVVGDKAEDSWKLLLRGLWWSGLRLGEALALRWDHKPGGVSVVLDGRRSVLLFDGEAQKNGKAGAVPMAPEFVEMLEPIRRESGYVFPVVGKDGAPCSRRVLAVGRRLKEIGAKARVVTNTATGKTATAHDLRRAFGDRWARLVLPQQLMELMRHESLETTMRFYVDSNAKATSAALWDAKGFQHSDQHSAPNEKRRRRSNAASRGSAVSY